MFKKLKLFFLITLLSFSANASILEKLDEKKEIISMDIILSDNDIQYLRDLRNKVFDEEIKYIKSDYKNSRNANIRISKKMFKIKFDVHGTDYTHLGENPDNFRYSFRVDLKDKYFLNMNRFSLIKASYQATYIDCFYYDLLYALFNFKVNCEYVSLSVNGEPVGLYVLEEKISKVMFERNGFPNIDLFKPYEKWDSKSNVAHIHQLQFVESAFRYNNFSGIDTGQISRLSELINATNQKNISQYFDFDFTSKIEALRFITGKYNGVFGDNIRLIYDSSNGKFNLFFRPEGVFFGVPANLDYLTYDRYLLNWNAHTDLFHAIKRDQVPEFLLSLYMNPKYLFKRNKNLKKIILNKKSILKLHDKRRDQFEKICTEYNRLEIWFCDPDTLNIQKSRSTEAISGNLYKATKYLNQNYDSFFINLIEKYEGNYILELYSDSIAPIELSNLILKDINGKIINKNKYSLVLDEKNKYYYNYNNNNEKNIYYLSNQYDRNLSWSIKPLKIKINFKDNNIDKIFDIEYKMINLLSNKKVDINKVGFKIIENNAISLKDNERYLKDLFKLENNEYINKDKIINLKQNLIIKKYPVRIKPGTKINMNNFNLIIENSFVLDGNKNEEIFIYSESEFGSVFALGNNNNFAKITHTNFSNGSMYKHRGFFAQGMLSIYNFRDVDIINSTFLNNNGEDAVNLKRVQKYNIKHNNFKDCFIDCLDIDLSKGEIIDNYFSNNENDNLSIEIIRDGIDFSFSKSIVKNNFISGYTDKGISIGENSEIFVLDNNFQNNFNAIALKDGSKLYLLQNEYIDNEIDLNAYKKKDFFDDFLLFTNKLDINYKSENQNFIKDLSQEKIYSMINNFYE